MKSDSAQAPTSRTNIQERSYEFALKIITLSRLMPETKDGRIIGRQVVRAGTSIGANVEEAQAATSKSEFVYRILIALREARETHYWLRLIRDARVLNKADVAEVLQEAGELAKILGAIASKARGKTKS